MNDHNEPTRRIPANGDEAFLGMKIGIEHGDGECIFERHNGIREVDAMLGTIRQRLRLSHSYRDAIICTFVHNSKQSGPVLSASVMP